MQIEVTLAEQADGDDTGLRLTASIDHDAPLTPEAARDFLAACGDEALRLHAETKAAAQ